MAVAQRQPATRRQQWRQSGTDFKDDVKSSLLLLRYLDDVSQQTRKGFWETNFMTDKTVTLTRAKNLIRARKCPELQFFKQCYQEYQDSIKLA